MRPTRRKRHSRAIGSALLHGDDPDRLRALAAALSAPAPPGLHTLGEPERRAWLMLTVQLFGARNCASCWSCWLPVPITASTPCPGRCRCRCVGVLWHESSLYDLLFVTLRKSEALFSPTTRYRDLALGPSLFHWESQSTTTAASATGQRSIHHAARGSRVLLLVREQRREGGVTEPFRCLGFATYEGHQGERRWRFAGGWSGRFRWGGCTAVVTHTGCCDAHRLLLGIAAGLAVCGSRLERRSLPQP